MKKKLFKRFQLILASVFIFGSVHSQEPWRPSSTSEFSTWSIGVNAGIISMSPPLSGPREYSTLKKSLGYGIYIKKQITPFFSFRLDGLRGQLKGNNGASSTVTGNREYETDLNYAGSLNAQLNLFNISTSKSENALQFYLSGGAGVVGYKTTTTSYAGITSTAAKTSKSIMFPVGLGAKYKISERINIDLGGSYNFVNSDGLAGNGGIATAKDKFYYAYAGLEFALGKGKQLAFHNPVAAVYDEVLRAKKGLQDQKLETDKLRSEMGELLKDSDGDGVADKLDKCPNTQPGVDVDGSGCPLKHPVIIEKVALSETDRTVVAEAIKSLSFDLGKSKLKPKSYPTLNKVAELLISKNYRLKLGGHTDNTGREKWNMLLSKNRAQAIMLYLVSRGVDVSKIEAVGYGSSQPVAPNDTFETRELNRRVEFTFY